MKRLVRLIVLEDGDLRRSLEELAARAGVPVRRILVVGGRAGSRPNARLRGLTARTRTVLLTSGLLDRGREVVEAAFAHELGHAHRRHSARCLLAGAACLTASWLIPEVVARGLGATAAALSLLALSPCLVALLVRLRRRFELEADREAADLLGAERYRRALSAGLGGSAAAARGAWLHPSLERRRAELAVPPGKLSENALRQKVRCFNSRMLRSDHLFRETTHGQE